MGIAPLAKQGKHFMMVYNLLDRMTMDMVVRNDALQRAGYDPNTPPQQRGKILKGMTIGITRPAAPTDIFSRFIMTGSRVGRSKRRNSGAGRRSRSTARRFSIRQDRRLHAFTASAADAQRSKASARSSFTIPPATCRA